MTSRRPIRGGVIAAGDGTRLRQAGFTVPKPLVPVAGVPLLESVIVNFRAAGIAPLTVIVNERDAECVDWARRRFPDVEIDFIVKTTRSSLESFLEVMRRAGPGRLLISTVDAWCAPGLFRRFVDAASERPAEATVLAVTPAGDDEKPLWVTLDAQARITGIGGAAGDAVTAGLYLVSDRVRAVVPPPLDRLRDLLMWLHLSGEPMYGERVAAVVDVDDATDIALAEALASSARRSRGGCT